VMGKPILIAPRNMAREVTEQDAARLLAGGSWCAVTEVRRPTAGQRRQARLRERRKAAGMRGMLLWFRPEVHALLHASKRKGESVAVLIERLLLTQARHEWKECGKDTHLKAQDPMP